MFEYKIKLKPVYSCPASEIPEGLKLPNNWTLSWHQLETFKAINNPNIDVIFNTAMTGDGKSLAAYLEMLQGDRDNQICYPMGLYPTNELARDQESQISNYIDIFNPNSEPRILRLSGASLEIHAETEDNKKWQAIERLTSNAEILITNPDIFHYLHRHAYLNRDEAPNRLWGQIDTKFNLLIFDEFHVFNAPQIAGMINTILLMRHTNRNHKFLFLSATPDQQLIKRLEKVGFRCKGIDPYEEGKYQFPDISEVKEQLELENWRQVAREINLTFVPLKSTYKASENWLWENRELILGHFHKHPNTKGSIILNSIASIKRLKPLFSEYFKPLIVAENTSLTGQKDKDKSLQADLVLGTSTIDVGVDFKINFLIFESADAGSFIQRLGRLGRHDGYEKQGNFLRFNSFNAYALCPNFLVERLFKGESASLSVAGIYNRPFFHQKIRENYRKINDFQGYYKRWSGIQSLLISGNQGLNHKTIRDQYTQSREAFKKDCETVFETNLKRVGGCLKKWGTEWTQLSGNKTGNPIAEDASSFRGSSSLLCGLYDLTETNESDQFKTYDLPGILSNLDIEPMTETAYLHLLESTSQRLSQPIPKGRFRYCLGFMKLHRYREERLNWRFTYRGDLKAISDSWKVQVLLGVQVFQPDNRWIADINKRVKGRGLVSYIISCPVEEAKKRLQLPMHFQIYPIDEAGRENMTSPYSIAFGQSALLLDTLAYRLKSKGDELWIC